jgi:hypothetical protein
MHGGLRPTKMILLKKYFVWCLDCWWKNDAIWFDLVKSNSDRPASQMAGQKIKLFWFHQNITRCYNQVEFRIWIRKRTWSYLKASGFHTNDLVELGNRQKTFRIWASSIIHQTNFDIQANVGNEQWKTGKIIFGVYQISVLRYRKKRVGIRRLRLWRGKLNKEN